MKFSVKDFFSKGDQTCRKLRIWSHLLKKSLMENLIFCAVIFPLVHLINWIPYSRTLTSQTHYFGKTDYDTKYFHVNEIDTFLDDLGQHENLYVLHLNIGSLRSNLDDFRTLLSA